MPVRGPEGQSPVQDPNVMPDGVHPPGVDPLTGYQGDYLSLIRPVVEEWADEVSAADLPPIDGARDQIDPHY